MCISENVSQSNRLQARILAILCVVAIIFASKLFGEGRLPLINRAHAHNDYLHPRPLQDALDCGFCSVEADIFLKNGSLLVAHESRETQPDRTLQALYLDSLRKRVRQNNGRVFPGGPEFTLLIDLKEDWRSLYPALRRVLVDYGDILSTFENGNKTTNAVQVIITRNRDLKMFDGETARYAAFDGDINNVSDNVSATMIPWISINWKTQFTWNGVDAMPESERSHLKQLVTRVHAEHRLLRFWNAPDNSRSWTVLDEAGVDLINTDDLVGVRNFFQKLNTKNLSPGK
jgi:hypothetical protein